jgi:hypothetical protein
VTAAAEEEKSSPRTREKNIIVEHKMCRSSDDDCSGDVCLWLGMSEKRKHDFFPKQILLPSLAGSCAVLFTHPLDLTKIRLQLG